MTDNYLEGYCKSSNDGAIFLDEIDEVKGGDLYKIIYMLANGVTKGRADKYGNARETFTFKILAQSSGEVGLEAKLNEDNLIAKGGQFVRIIELDADQMKGLGTFTRLSDNPIAGIKFENGAKQAEFLKEHAFKNNGIVIDSFLQKILAKGGEKCKKFFMQFTILIKLILALRFLSIADVLLACPSMGFC